MNKLNSNHTPVMSQHVFNLLNVKPCGVYVDATAGFGGHSQLILKDLDEQGKLVCIDRDQNAVNYLKDLFKNEKRALIVHDNFCNLLPILKKLKINGVDGILVDLGVSSPMFDNPTRGFSYHHEGRLDMRMDQNQKLDAHFIINNFDANQLINIFKKYGEIYDSKNVVHAILEYRKAKVINTTKELVEIIKNAIPTMKLHKHKHPARNYFQAIRIAVNDELHTLQKFLNVAIASLNIHGRLLAISFHSLEDRIVKQTFMKYCSSQIPKEVPIMDEKIGYALINKKPLIASENELLVNRRARSAKLRGIEKVF